MSTPLLRNGASPSDVPTAASAQGGRRVRPPLRRNPCRGEKPTIRLRADHHAVVEGTTLFPSRIRSANAGEWVLKRGEHSKKLGSHFSTGVWKGMPIFALTLTERATCPRSCRVWRECFGNGMPYAVRWRVDNALYAKITVELQALASAFPKGFTVRLHVLGDFPDRHYVEFWLDAVRAIPNLYVFGFTAWARNSELGALIEREAACWDRFRIRFSGDKGSRGSVVMDGLGPELDWIGGARICPARSKKPEKTCGSCAYCMSSKKPLVFARH